MVFACAVEGGDESGSNTGMRPDLLLRAHLGVVRTLPLPSVLTGERAGCFMILYIVSLVWFWYVNAACIGSTQLGSGHRQTLWLAMSASLARALMMCTFIWGSAPTDVVVCRAVLCCPSSVFVCFPKRS